MEEISPQNDHVHTLQPARLRALIPINSSKPLKLSSPLSGCFSPYPRLSLDRRMGNKDWSGLSPDPKSHSG